jgi:CRP-like cAMP-binding protein
MGKSELLANVPLFACLESEHLEAIARTAERLSYRQADVIIREGEQDSRLFVVLAGAVEVVKAYGAKQQRVLGELGPGSYFGEMALLNQEPRSATVVAKSDVEALCLADFDLVDELERRPQLALELIRTLAHRLRSVEAYLSDTLGGFVPICAACKRVREKDGDWTGIEDYISARADVSFSHSVCPSCDRELNPEFYQS